MKTSTNQARVRELLSYNSETGSFTWLKKSGSRCRIGSAAGTATNFGYRAIAVDGAKYQAHRLAWLYVYGVWPTQDLDHIDGNRSNNAIHNLREVSRSVNLQNKRAPVQKSRSGLLGANYRQNRNHWYSEIRVGDKKVYLGSFKTKEEAQAAYLAAKRIHHPGCTI